MRILLVLPRPLVPADMGGKIRSLNMFSRLAARHSITCFCLVPPGMNKHDLEATASLFEEFVPVPWEDTRTFSPLFYWQFLKSQVSEEPYVLYRHHVPSLKAVLEKHLRADRADVILFDFLHTAVNLPSFVPCPKVLFTHNVESQIWLRRAKLEAHPLKKALLKRELLRMQRAETALCQKFDLVLTVSKEDRALFENEFAAPPVRDLPTGVDTDYFSPRNHSGKRYNVVFVGAMDWFPNEDAVTFFVQEIYPRVRQELPEVTFTVAGRNPPMRILRLAQEDASLEVTGRVEDVRPFLARADCCVVPLRIAGGTRIKIFEAMAMGKPVVTTLVGAEGLPVIADQEIILADDPGSFSAAVLRVLREPAWARQIGVAARRTVCSKFGWDKAVAQLEQYLLGVPRHRQQAVSVGERCG
jgi:sugar transferase (PEP-CTERM/EpsH1 system associated)